MSRPIYPEPSLERLVFWPLSRSSFQAVGRVLDIAQTKHCRPPWDCSERRFVQGTDVRFLEEIFSVVTRRTDFREASSRVAAYWRLYYKRNILCWWQSFARAQKKFFFKKGRNYENGVGHVLKEEEHRENDGKGKNRQQATGGTLDFQKFECRWPPTALLTKYFTSDIAPEEGRTAESARAKKYYIKTNSSPFSSPRIKKRIKKGQKNNLRL
ncbi:unnamed protein product [Nesidiocoris tenuis]|uniref:Uncharacterized protein n=1 Tax=Nesidiocoris tenuis TaxID=355587 RepID=A0A6H5G2J9_9HEMI|nr:unnamed protein product [Nesidiocoris tenuis]